jgi:hypothetical protein
VPSGYNFSSRNYPGGYIGIDGDTIVVACLSNTGAESGAGAVYVKPAAGWTGDIAPIAILTDGQLDDLGWEVAISGDTIAISAITAGQSQSGAIQVYQKPAGGWTTTSTPTATLVASDPKDEVYLGIGLTFSGDTIVASTPEAGSNFAYGAAYVFVREGADWRSATETAKLTIPPPSTYYPSFGSSVALHGDMIVVGAAGVTPPDGAFSGGAVYYYRKPSKGWRTTSKPDGELYDLNAPTALQLGDSAAVQNGTIFSGALDQALGQVGAVYIFRVQ